MGIGISEPAGDSSSVPAYRPCVGIALFDRAGRVFMGRRRSGAEVLAHSWQMPQGGIDEGETPRDAAFRELYEETNVAAGSVKLLAESRGWHAYDLPPDLLKQTWRGRYRGQTQKWIALGFTGDDAEIDVERPGGGAHKPEFAEWRWEALSATPELIVPFKRPVYEAITREFADLTQWHRCA